MNEELERAIKILSGKINAAVQPDQALKFTQAALNLAHVKEILTAEGKYRKTKGVGSQSATEA